MDSLIVGRHSYDKTDVGDEQRVRYGTYRKSVLFAMVRIKYFMSYRESTGTHTCKINRLRFLTISVS